MNASLIKLIMRTGRFCLPVCAVMLLTGCIFREYDNCPEGIYLKFSPQNPKHQMPELIETVDVYMYDIAGNLAMEYNFDRQDIRPSDGAVHIPDFPYGEYRAVAAINQKGVFIPGGKDSYGTLHTELPSSDGTAEIPLLFTGETLLTYGLGTTGAPDIPVTVIKHNNHFDVKVHIIGGAATDEVTAKITAANTLYRFDGHESGADTPSVFLPAGQTAEETDGIYGFQITTLRLTLNASAKLSIERSTGQTIEINLIEELARVRDDEGRYLYDTEEKLDFEDRYSVEVTINDNSVITKLTINGWSVVRGDTGV